ncbi:hypothetical protein WA026_016804 [Henosepilachna vigintioctopunctata]|uniref:UNC93-like protein n=1 Tax=Henosepilachna vigintioctopunctata TaxID=420089 RepID=A0AAW1UZJ1_9CUCU
MAGYSPISNRSVRQFHQIKRKDSLSSSIGATSVRKLLAVVRNGPSQSNRTIHKATEPSKQNLIANLIILCVSHLAITATYLPYMALQSSLSIWSMPDDVLPLNINVGSLLLAVGHFCAGIVCLLVVPLNRRMSSNTLLCISYFCLTVTYTLNFYPVLYLMIPSSLMLGISLGLMLNCHISCLMAIATKLMNIYRFLDEDDDVKNIRYTCLIRRIARAFKGAHDFGLIIGSVISALIIFWTIGNSNTDKLNGNITSSLCPNNLTSTNCSTSESEDMSLYEYSSFLNDIFESVEGQFFSVLPITTAQSLNGFFVFLSGAATILIVIGMDTLNLHTSRDGVEKPPIMRSVREAFRDSRTQFIAPMMFFIGLEQAFIYSDFGKYYVVCTLGAQRLNFVYLAMGSLQSIAACTLSMLLRSIRRYYIVGVGFTFHSCLMLVLILWKPMEDDPALFFVISAAWGVCNAIWEMLSFTLLTNQYATDRWEAPFAVTSFYRLCGIGVAFTFHGLLCNYLKLYGLSFFMVVAVITFTYLDIRLENIKKFKNISRL